jgi:antitoxin component of MazEF toxin-antitoxin module
LNIQKIIKVGNYLYLPLSDEITEALQLKEGCAVIISVDPENKQILIQPIGQSADLGENLPILKALPPANCASGNFYQPPFRL